MAVGVGASGFIGIAPEVTPGTYVAPSKFLLLRDEGIGFSQDTHWRRPLRGIADVAGAVAGNFNVEGDVEIELTADQLPHLMKGMRGAWAKTGAGPYVYTFTPNANALPANTLSITVVRNGVAFGYTGCVIGSQEYSVDDGLLVGSFGILGRDEATQTVPTPVYPTSVPYGAGQYTLEIPDGTPVSDSDSFTLTINDNPEAQYRLRNSRAAAFVKYGERSVELSIERDFETRADYDAFKALTAQGISFLATKGASDSIEFVVPAAIKDSYDISGLSGQADLIRASIDYQGVYDAATSRAYQIVVTSSENVT